MKEPPTTDPKWNFTNLFVVRQADTSFLAYHWAASPDMMKLTK
jgi:hypothetical protein